jgi:hypothetical protein
MCLDLGLLNTDDLKEESIDSIVDIDAADETELRALNWFDVSSSYGWYRRHPIKSRLFSIPLWLL